MFKPNINQINDLINVRTILDNFNNDYQNSFDKEDEIDTSINTMLNLIIEGFNSVLKVMKERL